MDKKLIFVFALISLISLQIASAAIYGNLITHSQVDDTTSGADTYKTGFMFNVTFPTIIHGLQLYTNAGEGASKCYIMNIANTTLSGTSNVDVGTHYCQLGTPVTVYPNETYYAVADSGGGSAVTHRRKNSGVVYPIENETIIFIAGKDSAGSVSSQVWTVQSLNISTTLPVLLTTPEDDYGTAVSPISFSASTSASNIINRTLNIWYSNGTLFNSSTWTGSSNTITTSAPFTLRTSYLWNAEFCQLGICGIASSNYSLNYGFAINDVNYTSPVTEGSMSTITLNISSVSAPNYAYFYYNNTAYLTTPTSSGSDYLFSRTVTVPYVDSAKNISFYWNIFLNDGSSFNSSTYNQTVNILTLDNCGVGTYQIYNFTVKDEELNTYINGTLQNTTISLDLDLRDTSGNVLAIYSTTVYNNSNLIICSETNLTGEGYKVYLTAEYQADDYVKRFYYEDNNDLDALQQVILYDLLLSDSTSFLFEFTNQNNLPVDNAIIQVWRKYIGDGIFRQVETSRQDDNGQTVIHLVEEDVIYYFKVMDDGTLIYTSSEYTAKCLSSPCQLSLTSSSDVINWSQIYYDAQGYLVYINKSSRLAYLNFSLTDVHTVNFTLYKLGNSGVLSYVNSTTLTSNEGSLNSNIPLAYGNVSFFAYIYQDGILIKRTVLDELSDSQQVFGLTGVILAGFMIATLILMAVSEGALVLIIACFGVLVVYLMTMVDLGWLAVTSIALAGAVLLWKLGSRGGR